MFIAIALVLASPPTLADAFVRTGTWVVAGSTPEREVFVDTGHLQRIGSEVLVRQISVYREPEPVRGALEALDAMVYHCVDRTYSLVAAAGRGPDGSIIYAGPVAPGERRAAAIAPGTIAAGVFDLVCRSSGRAPS
jgi:hypothetical protein